MSAVEVTTLQSGPQGYASTWLLTCVPLKCKYGSAENREAFYRDFRVVARRTLNALARGEHFNQTPIGPVEVQFAFEPGGKRHGEHVHALITGLFPGKGAKLDYAWVRQQFNSALPCAHHVHGRLIKGAHSRSLQLALAYISKSKGKKSGGSEANNALQP
jgi:hypothetical protein